MSYKKNDDGMDMEVDLWKNPRGRPIEGAEKRVKVLSIRIEPYFDERLTRICKLLSLNKSDAVRIAIIQFINDAENQMKPKKT